MSFLWEGGFGLGLTLSQLGLGFRVKYRGLRTIRAGFGWFDKGSGTNSSFGPGLDDTAAAYAEKKGNTLLTVPRNL